YRTEPEEQVLVHKEFTYINGAVTQVLKCGPWKDLWKNERAPKVLFLVIPGNPGIVGYYQTFIQTLYFGLNQKYPVWVVSHAGHCKLPSGMEMAEDFQDRNDVFGLHVKLVLIGHSVGCYIILEIMKYAPGLEVLRSVLLFPTIEHIAQSPNGKMMTPLLCQLRYVLYVPVYLMTFLPARVKNYLVHLALRGHKHVDETVLITAVDMINMDCIANVMYLGSEEMRMITERNSAIIRQHLKKLTFYYGTGDRWCPVQFYEEMKMEFPDGDIRLCEKGIPHAFVSTFPKEVAEMVIDWVQDDLARLQMETEHLAESRVQNV
uniref:Lipid droplet-associated hydrolase n=1 Tax=Varanus komodoensis TaxID=61221 RepID=A0A8D2Q2Z9_VARKO